MRKLVSTLFATAGILVMAGGAQATVHGWSWEPSDGGIYEDRGGVINWIQSSFDTDTKQLSWYVNFGAVPNRPLLKTEGFSLALNNGPAMSGAEGELGLFYFDGKTLNSPRLSVYGYNGRTDASSYYDGTCDNDIHAPDQMFTSLESNSNSWILDMKNQRNADRSRTMGFTIDASRIIEYAPRYTDGSSNWTGAAYDQELGFTLNSFASLDAEYYSNGYLKQWRGGKEGSLKVLHSQTVVTDPVPEPASLLLLGGGLGIAGLLRRRRRQA